MICEYALEPELVATWHTESLFKDFIKCFGFNPDGHATGRVVVTYPKNWKKRVWEAFSGSGQPASSFSNQRRIEILLQKLEDPPVRRRPCSKWNDQDSWLENAEQENAHRPFHAILALDNPRNNAQVMRGKDILLGMDLLSDMEPPPLWSVTREEPVLRTGASMATHLKPMLRCATRILFVDPHFRPLEPRFRNPLKQFLEIICDGSRDVTLEYHTMHNDKKPAWNAFLDECQKYLPSLIPHGFTLTVRRWEERNIGEELHDRYILTDIGGVKIPRGLDENDRYGLDESERGTIDISRLSYEAWQQRLEHYGYYYNPDPSKSKEPAFDPEGQPIVIEGRRNN